MKLILLQCFLLHSVVGISMVPKTTGSMRQPVGETFTPTPSISTTSTTSGHAAATGTRARTNSISIRTTNTVDLTTITDLLSCEKKTSSPAPSLFNWNAQIDRLKSKSSLTSQLTHRLAAIQAHSKYKSIIMEEMEMEDSSISTSTSIPLGILWNQDSYREKVEKAVKTTLEYHDMQETPWDEWNFALTPDKFMLFHMMMTAVDEEFQSTRFDPEPVGFCEVGIVRHPNCKNRNANDNESANDHDANDVFIPCITNLVVSPNQRRRGIGKRMMDCAIRTVRVYGRQLQLNDGDDGSVGWKLNTVGLYVDGDNKSAMALYQHMGFRVTGTCTDVSGRVFMELQMDENYQ